MNCVGLLKLLLFVLHQEFCSPNSQFFQNIGFRIHLFHADTSGIPMYISPQFRHRGHSLMTSRSKREKVIYLVTTSLTKALNVLTMGVRVSKIGQNCVTLFTPKCTYVSILYVNIHARAPESLFCLLFHFPQLCFFSTLPLIFFQSTFCGKPVPSAF